MSTVYPAVVGNKLPGEEDNIQKLVFSTITDFNFTLNQG